MDDAEAGCRHPTVSINSTIEMSRRAWRSCSEGYHASGPGTVASADLGGSSKYLSEILKGRSGEGFHANIDWAWVSRS